RNTTGRGTLIVVDGVYSMEGDIADIPELARVASRYGAALAVDDAHALGVLGPNGEGTGAHFGMQNEVDIIAGTFSKSLASVGGFVAGDDQVIHYLKHHSRPFIFTASLPPANTAGVLAALRVMQEEPERRDRLWANARRLQQGFLSLGFDIGPTATPIVPVLIGPLETTFAFWRRLYDAGVFTNPVVPPAVPPSQCRLRTSVMATHTPEQTDFALEAFARMGKGMEVSWAPPRRSSGASRPRPNSPHSSSCRIASTGGIAPGSRRSRPKSRSSSTAARTRSSSTQRPSTSSPNAMASWSVASRRSTITCTTKFTPTRSASSDSSSASTTSRSRPHCSTPPPNGCASEGSTPSADRCRSRSMTSAAC